MTKVIKLEPRRVKHEHDRKDAKAKAMQQSFREVRLDQKKLQETEQQATRKLLAIFKPKGLQKPSPPTRRK
jgi:hypothetical protein